MTLTITENAAGFDGFRDQLAEGTYATSIQQRSNRIRKEQLGRQASNLQPPG